MRVVLPKERWLIGWVCISLMSGNVTLRLKTNSWFGRPLLLCLSTCHVLLGRVPFSSLSLVFEKLSRTVLPLPHKVILIRLAIVEYNTKHGFMYSSKLHHSPFLCRSQIPCSQWQRLHASSYYRRHDWTQTWRILLYPQTIHLSLHQKQINREFKVDNKRFQATIGLYM